MNTRGRPFEPGNSGKPPGALNRATRLAAELLDNEGEALTRKAVELALAGDIGALRLCLERIYPARRARVQIDLPKVETAWDLYVKMLLGMAIVFQMPTLVFFLAKMGLVSWRFLASQFKYAVLVIFIIAAVVTPSGDPYNQTILALPMIGLYIISIGIAWIFGPIAKKRTDEDD